MIQMKETDPTALQRLDVIEAGARRAWRLVNRRRIEGDLEVAGLVDNHIIVKAALGVQLRANGILDWPTSDEIAYALRFGGFVG